jgi:hypothetical protein
MIEKVSDLNPYEIIKKGGSCAGLWRQKQAQPQAPPWPTRGGKYQSMVSPIETTIGRISRASSSRDVWEPKWLAGLAGFKLLCIERMEEKLSPHLDEWLPGNVVNFL